MPVTFLCPATGLGFLTQILKDIKLMPSSRESLCHKIFQKTLIFLISMVALPIISSYAITHYNAPGLITKSIGAIASFFFKITVFGHTYEDFWPDIKRHLIFTLADFVVITASPIFTLFFLFKPGCINYINNYFSKICLPKRGIDIESSTEDLEQEISRRAYLESRRGKLSFSRSLPNIALV